MEQNLDNPLFRDFSGLELTSNTVVLKAKVTASKTLSTTYYPWVACAKGGMVQFAHCTCPAGFRHSNNAYPFFKTKKRMRNNL
ncbi:Uncharacterized protein APZ42_009024 [Daphnia magna]|uniref:Uncharacterized protein n=1 Tax=Daphnia magna TaxID=35525 RepID=A0A0P6BHW9_9CRUS|nr:Uncharacterized protein APZ42_009024 [Daphnia magna]